MPFWFLCILLAIVELQALDSHAGDHWTENRMESERIMQLRLLTGEVYSNDFIVLKKDQQWFLPLGNFTNLLSIAVSVSSSHRKAEGYILREDREFFLDHSQCHVILSGQRIDYNCDDVFVDNQDAQDIFLAKELIEAWFPLKISVNQFTSQIIVDPKEKLPLQLKNERLRNTRLQSQAPEERYKDFTRVETPYAAVDGFFLDHQSSYTYSKTGTKRNKFLRHDTSLSAELLTMETEAFLGGDQKNLDPARFTLARRSEDRSLPLALSEIELVDANLPSVSQVFQSALGRGVLLSSFPLNRSQNFSTQNLTGTLTEGWEVELYQNGVLIDRKLEPEAGQYRFVDIPLQYGQNIFELVFYGPQGQVRSETKIFNVNDRLLKPGEGFFHIGVGRVRNEDRRLVFQVNQSVARNITLFGGYARKDADIDINDGQYTFLGLQTYFGGLLANLTATKQISAGQAFELDTKFALNQLNFGIKYNLVRNFNSDLFSGNLSDAVRNQLELGVNFLVPTVPSISTTWFFLFKEFQSGLLVKDFRNRLSTNLFSIYLSNELTFTPDRDTRWSGALTSNFLFYDNRLKVDFDYDQKDAKSVSLSLVRKVSPTYSLRFTGSFQFIEDIFSASVNISREFSQLLASLELTGDSNDDYSIKGLVGFSLSRPGGTNQLVASSKRQANFGALQARVFHDQNYNGILDADEALLPDAKIVVSEKREPIAQEREGAFVPRLTGYRVAAVEVANWTLEDIYLSPAAKGYTFVPRVGKTTLIDLPVVTLSEIDGMLLNQSNSVVDYKRLELELLDADTNFVILSTRPERDGFYLLTGLKPGRYRLRVKNSKELKGLVTQPASREIFIPNSGKVVEAQDFYLGN